MKVSVLAPLNVGEKSIGLIALGEKETKEAYNKKDLELQDGIHFDCFAPVAYAFDFD